MKRLARFVLVFGLTILAAAPAAFAAENYYEGWDVPDDLAGWIPNTIHATVAVVNAGGNPGGYLQSTRDPGGTFPIGATTELPEASGDYATPGVFEVSFDVLFDTGTFTSAVFRARFEGPTHNGWFFPFTADFTPDVWRSYVIAFDPTWTDAEALAAGWISDGDPGLTFAQTFGDVYHPEIRISGTGEPLVACIDNFRIRACPVENYYEGWDNNDVAGWIPNTTHASVAVVNAGGNPAGYLQSSRDPGGTFPIGATTELPAASDDYAAAGVVGVSFDVLFDTGNFTSAVFRARFEGPTHNGWSIPFTADFTPGVWRSYVIAFDPTWSDAEAIAAGWVSDGDPGLTFAQTFSDVYHPEIRISGTGEPLVACIDNFRILACPEEDPCDPDTEPPTIDITLSRETLWPPNHKLVEVCATVDVDDNCDPDPVVELVSITSDEPDNGLGDGDTEDDIQSEDIGTDDTCFLLRSERQGGGDGRVYTITYCVTDASGNETCASAEVVVPHDQSGSALASLGFSADGSRIRQGASEYALVIRSTSTFDANLVDPSRTFVGNHMGVYAPTRSELVDVERDGLPDLRLFFDSAPTYQMLREDEQGIPTVALRYETTAGAGYLVPDIFGLGPPMEVLTGISAPGDGRALVSHAQPNPFTASTEVRYSVAGGRVELVDIAVYDVSGRLVRTLYRGTRGPGSYVAAWDGRNDEGAAAGAGVYFLRADVGGGQAFERLVLMR